MRCWTLRSSRCSACSFFSLFPTSVSSVVGILCQRLWRFTAFSVGLLSTGLGDTIGARQICLTSCLSLHLLGCSIVQAGITGACRSCIGPARAHFQPGNATHCACLTAAHYAGQRRTRSACVGGSEPQPWESGGRRRRGGTVASPV